MRGRPGGLEPVTLVSGAVSVPAGEPAKISVEGVSVEIPAGALAVDATLTLTVLETPDFATLQIIRTVTLEPTGVVFTTPCDSR